MNKIEYTKSSRYPSSGFPFEFITSILILLEKKKKHKFVKDKNFQQQIEFDSFDGESQT